MVVMNDMTPDQARAIRAQLENLQGILTQPQRAAMLEMVSEFEGEQGKASEDTLRVVRAVASRIQSTFTTMLADAPPPVRKRIQQVANQRMERARLAASVPRQNWYQEYMQRTNWAYSMDGYLAGLRAMRQWQNPNLPTVGPAKFAEAYVVGKPSGPSAACRDGMHDACRPARFKHQADCVCVCHGLVIY